MIQKKKITLALPSLFHPKGHRQMERWTCVFSGLALAGQSLGQDDICARKSPECDFLLLSLMVFFFQSIFYSTIYVMQFRIGRFNWTQNWCAYSRGSA
jgi:hypothetical protein